MKIRRQNNTNQQNNTDGNQTDVNNTDADQNDTPHVRFNNSCVTPEVGKILIDPNDFAPKDPNAKYDRKKAGKSESVNQARDFKENTKRDNNEMNKIPN